MRPNYGSRGNVKLSAARKFGVRRYVLRSAILGMLWVSIPPLPRERNSRHAAADHGRLPRSHGPSRILYGDDIQGIGNDGFNTGLLE